jgi:alpha-tubulin suppressor-like RCC1 family protein
MKVLKAIHSMVIENDNSLWTWGYNKWGQLGDGTCEDKLSPIQIMQNVIVVSTVREHSMATKNDYSLWGWGNNRFGKIGDGTNTIYDKSDNILENNNKLIPDFVIIKHEKLVTLLFIKLLKSVDK